MTTDRPSTRPLRCPARPTRGTRRRTPSRRAGPPYHMTDMIAAEPRVAAPDPRAPRAIRGGPAAALAGGRSGRRSSAGDPVVVTGCGTSEHAALGVVEILREAAGAAGLPSAARSRPAQAFELSLDPPAGGLVIGISHEGGTAATNAALAAARGGRRADRASSPSARRSPAGALADDRRRDRRARPRLVPHRRLPSARSLAAAAVGGAPVRSPARRRRRGAAPGRRHRATRPARRRSPASSPTPAQLLVIASGADRPAGRELVLKVEEASWLPSAYRDLETFLHGHLPATGPDDRARPDPRRSRPPRRAARRAPGRPSPRPGCSASARPRSSPPTSTGARRRADAGRPAARVARRPSLPAPVAALLGTATPLQLLTERLARARGTNPDLIRRDDPVYLAASAAADG